LKEQERKNFEKNIKIFNSNINSKYNLIPFNLKGNYKGITKYYPADSKE
jgi:hypothetical protein